jgi:hypothetical protein
MLSNTVCDHAADVVAGRLRGTRDVACATRVVDDRSTSSPRLNVSS